MSRDRENPYAMTRNLISRAGIYGRDPNSLTEQQIAENEVDRTLGVPERHRTVNQARLEHNFYQNQKAQAEESGRKQAESDPGKPSVPTPARLVVNSIEYLADGRVRLSSMTPEIDARARAAGVPIWHNTPEGEPAYWIVDAPNAQWVAENLRLETQTAEASGQVAEPEQSATPEQSPDVDDLVSKGKFSEAAKTTMTKRGIFDK